MNLAFVSSSSFLLKPVQQALISRPRKPTYPRTSYQPTAKLHASALDDETPLTLSSTAPAPGLENSCFGRGEQFPRRLVGLYELEREGVNPNKLLGENTAEENSFSIVVGLFVAALLVSPLILPNVSLEAPMSAVAATLLTTWAVDALALNGILGRALSISMQNSTRVAYHEAGHFLVGHLLGFKVEDYCLPTAGALLNRSEEDGPPGVKFGSTRATGDAHSVSAVGMAGIAAEVLKYGRSEGGAEDMADVSRGIRACNGGRDVHPERMKGVVRWGLIQAVRLLKEHSVAHDALCDAMKTGVSTEECIAIVESNVNRDKLLESRSVYAAVAPIA